MTPREAYIALNLLDGIGPVRVQALVDALGSVDKIFGASVNELCVAKGIGTTLAQKLLSFGDQVDVPAEIEKAEQHHARIITRADDDYPAALAEIYDPPLALYVRGTLAAADVHSIGVVGSRRCTHYGTSVADRLSFQLAKQGYTVTSGLARGIDGAAHEGALKGKGRTIAVLGCGIDQVYPAEHAELARSIAEQGAVMTEFPVGFKPTRQSFPQRNRIISGLSKGILVVEAARGSGAMLTVDEANAQGRLVFAVPGRIDNPSAGGCNQLLKQGAKLVEDVDDILEEFEYLLSPNPEGREDPGHVAAPQVQLSADEQAVLASFTSGEMLVDDVIRQSGLGVAVVSTCLLTLEMKRQVKSLPGRKVAKV